MTTIHDEFEGNFDPKAWADRCDVLVPPDYVRSRLKPGDVLRWTRNPLDGERWFINDVEQFPERTGAES